MLEAPKLDQIGQDALAMANYIEEHGWCQEFTRIGRRVCIRGAVVEIAGYSFIGLKQNPRYYNIVNALTNKLGSIAGWNDAPTRTKEQVIEMLKEFAYNRQIKGE